MMVIVYHKCGYVVGKPGLAMKRICEKNDLEPEAPAVTRQHASHKKLYGCIPLTLQKAFEPRYSPLQLSKWPF